MGTTQAPNTQETLTVNQPDRVTTIEMPHSTNSYRTKSDPIYIPTTTEETITQAMGFNWEIESVSTNLPAAYSTKEITDAPTTPKTNIPESTTQEPTATKVQNRTVRIQPGTIVMMDSEYLKEKYLKTGLAKTFHRALLADYFGLSEEDMKRIGMTVVAWGFSYQVKDKATKSLRQAQKYFCDFKFRSSTFNAGYVGADINIGIVKLDG